MSPIFSRRSFLALTGSALAVPAVALASNLDDADDDDVPVLLDHIILGCNDLDRGIEAVEEATGVRPAIGFTGPDDGSRKRPDGSVLTWKTINLADDRNGLIPFFIEWSADSVHPSKDAPARCTLEYFEILSADPDELSSILKRIGLDLPVQRSDKARLHALISGPKGDAKLST